jgi:hypothetical protein
MEAVLERGDLIYAAEGYELYATNDATLAIAQWKEESACRLAQAMHHLLRRHALSTNFVEVYDPCGLVVKRVEPLPVAVIAQAIRGDAKLEWHGADGTVFTREEVARLPGMKAARLDMMEDTGLQAVRSSRAHLQGSGVACITLELVFGIDAGGACLLQVINPVRCDLGTPDYNLLATRLGGEET